MGVIFRFRFPLVNLFVSLVGVVLVYSVYWWFCVYLFAVFRIDIVVFAKTYVSK